MPVLHCINSTVPFETLRNNQGLLIDEIAMGMDPSDPQEYIDLNLMARRLVIDGVLWASSEISGYEGDLYASLHVTEMKGEPVEISFSETDPPKDPKGVYFDDWLELKPLPSLTWLN